MFQHIAVSRFFVSACCCLFVLSNILTVNTAESSSAKVVKKEGLYAASDNVVIVNSYNVDDLVRRKSNVWVIQFYNSWCGHCIQFAPTWKTFATDLKAWSPVVSFGAVDCSTGENLRVCREFRVVAYPSVLMVPPNFRSYKSDSRLVQTMRTKQKNEMKAAILDYITSPQFPVPPTWPALHPVKSLMEVRQGMTQQSPHKLVAVILEDERSTVGLEVILDLVDYPDMLVRRMDREDALQEKTLGDLKFPSVYSLVKDPLKKPKHLISGTGDARSDRRRFVDHLMSLTGHLDSQGQRIRGQGQGQGHADDDERRGHSQQSQNQTDGKGAQGDVKVYMRDLQSALSYALTHEVSLHSVIQGDSMAALQRFVAALAKHFPGGPAVKGFLHRLDIFLNATQTLTGQEWLSAINDLQDQDCHLPQVMGWAGCAGSRPRYRGYPCGLWSLFHSLTVAAYQDQSESKGLEVPQAIRGYMQHFFGCAECSHHFLSMSSNLPSRIHKPADAIMWLWLTHNKVNRRLHGDLSEDPLHPKIQFPSARACPKCRPQQDSDSDSVPWWNSNAVFAFLVKVYSKENLVPDTESSSEDERQREKVWRQNVRNVDRTLKRPEKQEVMVHIEDGEDGGGVKDMDWMEFQQRREEMRKSNKLNQADGGVYLDSIHHPSGFDLPYFPLKGGIHFGGVDVGVYAVFYMTCVVMLVVLYYYFIVHKRSGGGLCFNKRRTL